MGMRLYLRSAGEILITLAIVILGLIAYLYWGTAMRASNAQNAFAPELRRQWAGPHQILAVLTNPADLSPGTPLAIMEIPRLGTRWQFIVVQGDGLAQLALGPGHVPGTALPGMLGNFAVAGHRVTAGNPFWNLPRLRAGDLIDVETAAGSYEYAVTGQPDRVSGSDTAVLAPVPGHPGLAPQRRLITLITCDPPWTGTGRVIVTGVLIRLLPRAQGSEG
jgi:sortase A